MVSFDPLTSTASLISPGRFCSLNQPHLDLSSNNSDTWVSGYAHSGKADLSTDTQTFDLSLHTPRHVRLLLDPRGGHCCLVRNRLACFQHVRNRLTSLLHSHCNYISPPSLQHHHTSLYPCQKQQPHLIHYVLYLLDASLARVQIDSFSAANGGRVDLCSSSLSRLRNTTTVPQHHYCFRSTSSR